MLRSLLSLLTLVACAHVPTHAGYAASDRTPWSRAKTVELDEEGQAKLSGEVSYPDRQRARWYALDLVDPGTLRLRLSYDPFQGAEESDLGIELLDGAYRVRSEADEEAEQGEQRKQRVVEGLAPGRYLVHIFARGKTDRAEFDVRVAFTSDGGAVPLLAALPAVPAADDTPPRRQPRREAAPPRREHAAAPATPRGGVRARVTEYGSAGGKTRVILNKGTDDGVDRGASGYLVSKTTGKKLGGSEFTVRAVSASECEALISRSVDQVQANKTAIILTGE